MYIDKHIDFWEVQNHTFYNVESTHEKKHGGVVMYFGDLFLPLIKKIKKK